MMDYSQADLQRMIYRELAHPDDLTRDSASFEAFRRGELNESEAVTRCLHKYSSVV